MRKFIFALILASTALAQTGAQDVKLSEVEGLKVASLIKDATILSLQEDAIKKQLQSTVDQLNGLLAKLRKEKNVGDDAVFNPQTMSFIIPAKNETKPEVKK